jgi:DNA polymerase III epsilon subunit-like protein|tara:strand:+ start:1369 stop:1908 length:540 start_codon:yes stop_codon:yes gene_type:complete
MIVFDLETTGLPKAEGSDLELQPKIIEFGAIKLNEKLEEISKLEILIDPGILLDPKITKITGLTDKELKGQKPFVAVLDEITDFFLGEKILIAHNLPFDKTVLKFELERLDKVTNFPWPPHQICTVEVGETVWNKKRKLGDIYLEVTGQEHKGAHRSIADVRALIEIVRWYKKESHLDA